MVDLDNTLFTFTLSERQTNLARVGEDVTADRLLGVTREHGSVGIGNDLVGDEDSDAVFVGERLKRAEEASEVLLTIGELTAACVIGAVQGGGRIDDDQGETIFGHHGGGLNEELRLVIGVESLGDSDVVEDIVGIEAVTFSDGAETLGAESTFGVDEESHSFTTALFERKLAHDAKLVAELRLASAEFTEEFSDAASFDTAAEELVEFFGAGLDADEFLAHFVHLGGACEPERNELGAFSDDLVGSLIRDALDSQDLLLASVGDAFDGVEAAFDECLENGALDAVLFEELEWLGASGTTCLDLWFFL